MIFGLRDMSKTRMHSSLRTKFKVRKVRISKMKKIYLVPGNVEIFLVQNRCCEFAQNK